MDLKELDALDSKRFLMLFNNSHLQRNVKEWEKNYKGNNLEEDKKKFKFIVETNKEYDPINRFYFAEYQTIDFEDFIPMEVNKHEDIRLSFVNKEHLSVATIDDAINYYSNNTYLGSLSETDYIDMMVRRKIIYDNIKGMLEEFSKKNYTGYQYDIYFATLKVDILAKLSNLYGESIFLESIYKFKDDEHHIDVIEDNITNIIYVIDKVDNEFVIREFDNIYIFYKDYKLITDGNLKPEIYYYNVHEIGKLRQWLS